MNSFLLVCNRKKWLFSDFFASNPSEGYWKTTKKAFEMVQRGDRLYLRVTTGTGGSQAGVHYRFRLRETTIHDLPKDHWTKGNEPIGKFRQFLFDVDRVTNPHRFVDLNTLRREFDEDSRLLKTPQASVGIISEKDADRLDVLMGI